MSKPLTAEQKFINDLKKNGKTMTWQQYADKYFPGKSESRIRDIVNRNRVKVVIPPSKKVILKPMLIRDNTDTGPSLQEKALLDRVKKEGRWGSSPVMTEACNPGHSNGDWANDVLRKYNYVTKPKSATPQTIIEDRKVAGEVSELKEQIKAIAFELSQKDEALKIFQNIGSYDLKKINIPEPSGKSGHQATMIAQWGDWHSDEIVLPAVVNGVNEYNPSIFKERVKKMVPNLVKVLNTQRSSIDIREGIIHLVGDFITGWIHPEGEQTNAYSPIDAVIFVIESLIPAIDYVVEKSELDKIRVICSLGNHGRISKRNQSNMHEVNLEKIIYYYLMREYRDNDKVLVIAGDSPLQYISVYGKPLRFFHGHQIRYLGGIGGMTVPLYKALLRWDANQPSYYNFMGDKHTYCQPTPNCQVNGSLIGMNAYGMENGFTFQPPLQSFTLMDSKLGITIKAPIFCD